MPLLVFPYILLIIGAELYAKLVFAEAIAQVVSTLVLYSFELDGPAAVVGRNAIDDGESISTALSEVLICRALILVTSAVIVAAVTWLINPSSLSLILSWLLVSLSVAVQPGWLFQGLQRNVPLAILSVSSRALALTLVVRSIHVPGDYTMIPLLIGGCYVIAAVVALLVALHLFGLSLVWVRPGRIREVLAHGREVFFGNVSVLLYRDLNVVVLGSLGVPGNGIAAYSLAEKTIKGLQAAMRPLNQVLLPRALLVARRANRIDRTVFADMRRLVTPQLLSLLVIVAVLVSGYAVAKEYVPAIRRLPNLARAETLASIMAVAVFFGVVNFMLGMAGLNHLNERRYYFKSVLASGTCGAAVCVLLAHSWGEFAAATNVVLSEALLCALVVRKYLQVEAKQA